MSMSPSMMIILTIWAVVVGLYVVLLFIGSFLGLRTEDTLYLSAGESKLEAEQRQVQKRIARIAPLKRGLAYGSVAMTAVLAGTWMVSVFHDLMH